MIFTSYEFIFFLVIVFALYYMAPKKFQWVLLLVASYTFYAYAGVKFLVYILVTTVSTYIFSSRIGKIHEEQDMYLKQNKGELSRQERKEYKEVMKSKRFRLLVICLFINFGILGVIKYTNFVIANVNSLFANLGFTRGLTFVNFAVPLGISFYTFQTMGYVIDIYRGKYKYEKNLFKLALFTSFFPQLIQGPISRFDDLKETMFSEHSFDSSNISFGVHRIIWGYFKKLVIADRLLSGVTTIVGDPATYQGVYVLLGMFFYAIQLYADFTGGIDITIGIGQIFGIRLKENFIRPFFSKSVTEYWRRWHISLGSWFRDYMFYPISVSGPMLKLSKSSRRLLGDGIGKRLPVYISSIIVWFTTGIWHGAAWNFIVWGLLNCLVILVSQELEPLYVRFHNRFDVRANFTFRLFQVVRTFWIMSFIRILDCYRDVGTTFRMYGTIFTKFNFMELFRGGLLEVGLSISDYIVLIPSVLLMLVVSLIGRRTSLRELLAERSQAVRYAAFAAIIFGIIIFGAYGIGYDSSKFIYSQF
ncbi:MAG: MBOAT family protein [Clostridiales bacterium]|nr:MBOAT family protein [Clostridiales bacterium]